MAKRRTRSKSKHVEPGDTVRFKSKRHGVHVGKVASLRIRKSRKRERMARSLGLPTGNCETTIAQIACDDFDGYFETNVLDCTIVEKGFIEDRFIENDAAVKVRRVKDSRRSHDRKRREARTQQAYENDLTSLADGEEIVVQFKDGERRVVFRGFTASGNVRFEHGVKSKTDWLGKTTTAPRIRSTSPKFVKRVSA